MVIHVTLKSHNSRPKASMNEDGRRTAALKRGSRQYLQ